MGAIRILGIDPGSRLTGYGCVDVIEGRMHHVTHGTLRLASTSGKATVPLEQRLLLIHQGLSEVILEYKPHIMVVERVFFAKNAVSALKLGQARGAAILSGAIHALEICEYSPTEVKSAVVGHGQADKEQVARMVKILLGHLEFDTHDASDGLALAITHAQIVIAQSGRLGRALRSSANSEIPRTTTLASSGSSPKKKRMSLAESLGITAEMIQGKRRVTLRTKD